MATVKNKYNVEIDFDAAVEIMDFDICEAISSEYDDIESEQEFFNLYCDLHLKKFGQPFELAKPNPVW